MASFDYSTFSPGELEPVLQALTSLYGPSLNLFDKTYSNIPLPVVKMTYPQILQAKNIFSKNAQDSLPSVRDITTYASLADATLPVILDKNSLITTLLPILNGWHLIDVTTFATDQEQFAAIFAPYVRNLSTVISELKKFHDDFLVVPEGSNLPDWYQKSLFDNIVPILSSIATFPLGDQGVSALATITTLPIDTVSKPLSSVLSRINLALHPRLRQTIGTAIQDHIITPLDDYFTQLSTLSEQLSPFVEKLVAARAAQDDVIHRLNNPTNSTDPPVTSDECVAAWAAVQKAADAFIQVVAGGSSQSAIAAPATFQLASIAAAHTEADVTEKFGPPSSASALLPDMSALTTQIVTRLNQALTLPFTDQLQATDSSQGQTSVLNLILTSKNKYGRLQTRTQVIIRQLEGYATIQETILPTVEAEGGLTLSDLLNTNLPLTTQYKQQAAQIASDTQALLQEFQNWCNVLSKNLNDITIAIAKDKTQLDAAQKEYDSAAAGAIIMELLGAVYTGAAIAALADGDGELAIKLGTKAKESFSTMIDDEVQAGNLSVVIDNLKNVIKISQDTYNQLVQIVPLFTQMIDMMGQINGVWNSIWTNMDDVQKSLSSWESSANFTQQVIAGAVSNWVALITACQNYINAVTGSAPSQLLAATAASPIVSTTISAAIQQLTSSPQYLAFVTPSTPADRLNKFKALTQSSTSNDLLDALSAPQITLGLHRSQLSDAASLYLSVASQIRSDYSDSAQDAENLSSAITTQLIPSLTTAVNFFVQFANGQQDPFAGGLTKDKLASFVSAREQQVEQGSNLAKAAESAFISFRSASSTAYDKLTAHLNELNTQLTSERASLKSLQDQYNKWSWTKYLGGVGTIIYDITNSITKTTSQISALQTQVASVIAAHDRVASVQQLSGQIETMTSGLSQGWSDLTTKTQLLQVFLQVSDANPDDQALQPLVQSSWKALSASLATW